MEGKTKSKNKIWKVLLLAMSFLLTIVLTASITLAWFFDTDWASNEVTMAGAVGIELRDESAAVTSGSGSLHFLISSTESIDPDEELKAYPGQAVDVEASVFNNGGTSITNWWASAPENTGTTENPMKPTDGQIAASGAGSACYVRAHFLVYTNIGTGENAPTTDQLLNAQALYEFMVGLVETQNKETGTDYQWVYYRNPDATMELDGSEYFNGEPVDVSTLDSTADDGYFYLCWKGEGQDNKTLRPLEVGATSTFLWNSTFIIPWQLTNFSADKHIFVALSFQAIQTFIPKIENGKIVTDAKNQLPSGECDYDAISVQTVFNSSKFDEVSTWINGVNYGDTTKGYVKANTPVRLNPSTGLLNPAA